MLKNFVVYHRLKKQQQKSAVLLQTNGCHWNTCLREIVFSLKEEQYALQDWEVYRGYEAYQFCLQIICGLKSPLIGETEVFGQFKKNCANNEYPQLQQIFVELIRDAKKIRNLHLQGLGSQSYGSLVRFHLKTIENVHVIGSGQLVEAILPWLCDSWRSIKLFCRNPQIGHDLLKKLNFKLKHSSVDALNLDEINNHQRQNLGLVVAAPIRHMQWQKLAIHQYKKVIDLREQNNMNAKHIVSLDDLFATQTNQHQALCQIVEKANQEIKELSLKQLNRQRVRPFGWEDLCG